MLRIRFQSPSVQERRSKVVDRQCDCAERTGDLVVFTCPSCLSTVRAALEALTARGILVNLDESGSVSASVEVEEFRG